MGFLFFAQLLAGGEKTSVFCFLGKSPSSLCVSPWVPGHASRVLRSRAWRKRRPLSCSGSVTFSIGSFRGPFSIGPLRGPFLIGSLRSPPYLFLLRPRGSFAHRLARAGERLGERRSKLRVRFFVHQERRSTSSVPRSPPLLFFLRALEGSSFARALFRAREVEVASWSSGPVELCCLLRDFLTF